LAHGWVHIATQFAVTSATVVPEAIQGSTGLSRLYCDMSRHRSSRTFDLRERMLLDSSQQSWESAAACEGLPTVYNSVSDKLSRRWGTQKGVSCAFRDANGSPLYTWPVAPRCLSSP
ncbi:uncharacterized protein HaLaN_29160, partial [Haematococcus lacustris]